MPAERGNRIPLYDPDYYGIVRHFRSRVRAFVQQKVHYDMLRITRFQVHEDNHNNAGFRGCVVHFLALSVVAQIRSCGRLPIQPVQNPDRDYLVCHQGSWQNAEPQDQKMEASAEPEPSYAYNSKGTGPLHGTRLRDVRQSPRPRPRARFRNPPQCRPWPQAGEGWIVLVRVRP